MANKLLGVSWLHGQFHAASLQSGGARSSWTAPGPVHTPEEFARALASAVQETGFTGQKVVIVLDHRNLLFHVQEAPPAKGKMLQKLFDRLVAKNQFFDEPAAHVHLELPVSKGSHRHLLALLPRTLVAFIRDTCLRQGLKLVALWPATAVLASRLRQLPSSHDEAVVLATLFGDSMSLILGQSDGTLLFSRTVALGGASHVERALQEINRTLHYAQQQFGALVNQLFIAGPQMFAALKGSSIRAGLKILEAAADEGPNEILLLAAGLSIRSPLNFARSSGTGIVAPRILAAAGIAAALVASVLTTVHVETQIHAREQTARAAEAQLRQHAETQTTARALHSEAQRLQSVLSVVGNSNEPPVIELFARHLPALIPGHVRLTEVHLEESPVGWTVGIKGAIRTDAADLITGLESLDQALEKSPFQLKISDSSYQQLFRGDAENTGRPGSLGGGSLAEVPFFINGAIP